MHVEEQVLTLFFPTPIWRFQFSGYEAVNDTIREELAQLDWAKLGEENEVTQSHTHKPALLSGVYYVDKPENSGDLVFVDVNQFHDYNPKPLPGEIDPITSPQVVVNAHEGTMIVFPSWLPHEVPRNDSDRDRVSVSFNAVLTARSSDRLSLETRGPASVFSLTDGA